MNTLFIFSRYGIFAASSRLRVYSLFNHLNVNGYINKIHPLFKQDRFIAKSILQRIVFVLSLLQSFIERIYLVFSIKENDIVVVQYEIFPFFSNWAELRIKKRKAFLVLDFDDAFYLSYKDSKFEFLKSKYESVFQVADLVFTGSPMLTKYISVNTSNVVEIPTVVQELYKEQSHVNQSEKFIIGWIGSQTTSRYIDQIAPVLNKFLLKNPETELWLIGYSGLCFSNSSNVRIIKWSEENERMFLPQINVGIMPLSDDEWANGKCGFKLIQYMAAGKPTISTPLEANIKIDSGNGNLFATTPIEWSESLSYFLNNKNASNEVGKKNLEKARFEYVFSAVLKKYENAFESLLRSNYFKK